MSLAKAIYYGKEHRKEYYDSRRFDWSCKNHGSCGYCKSNRTYHRTKTELESLQDVRDYFDFTIDDYFLDQEYEGIVF